MMAPCQMVCGTFLQQAREVVSFAFVVLPRHSGTKETNSFFGQTMQREKRFPSASKTFVVCQIALELLTAHCSLLPFVPPLRMLQTAKEENIFTQSQQFSSMMTSFSCVIVKQGGLVAHTTIVLPETQIHGKTVKNISCPNNG